MREKYSAPEMEILFFAIENIVYTSGDGNSVVIPETDGWTEED